MGKKTRFEKRVYNSVSNHFYPISLRFYFYFFTEREREREKGRETLTACLTHPPPGTEPRNLGTCPDRGSSQQCLAGWHPTNWATPVRAVITFEILLETYNKDPLFPQPPTQTGLLNFFFPLEGPRIHGNLWGKRLEIKNIKGRDQLVYILYRLNSF